MCICLYQCLRVYVFKSLCRCENLLPIGPLMPILDWYPLCTLPEVWLLCAVCLTDLAQNNQDETQHGDIISPRVLYVQIELMSNSAMCWRSCTKVETSIKKWQQNGAKGEALDNFWGQIGEHKSCPKSMQPSMVLMSEHTTKELLARVEHALGTDRPQILESLRKNGNLLARMPENLRADKEVVLVAVRQCGSALEFAVDPLRSDRELAFEAVKQSGDALRVLQDTLRADREVVLQAVTENGNAMEYADSTLRKDPSFLLQAIGTGAAAAPAVSFAAEELLQDKSFLLQIVRRNPWTLGFLPGTVCRDPDMVREAVKRNGRRWNPLHPNCKRNGRSTWARI